MSQANWNWLSDLVIHLELERKFRFGSVYHLSTLVSLDLPTPSLPNIGLTPFAQAMPDDCKQPDSILAYRQYYRRYKSHLHHWTKRAKPTWL